jgi:hypothetical protein
MRNVLIPSWSWISWILCTSSTRNPSPVFCCTARISTCLVLTWNHIHHTKRTIGNSAKNICVVVNIYFASLESSLLAGSSFALSIYQSTAEFCRSSIIVFRSFDTYVGHPQSCFIVCRSEAFTCRYGLSGLLRLVVLPTDESAGCFSLEVLQYDRLVNVPCVVHRITFDPGSGTEPNLGQCWFGARKVKSGMAGTTLISVNVVSCEGRDNFIGLQNLSRETRA